jgi:hypothetical protein
VNEALLRAHLQEQHLEAPSLARRPLLEAGSGFDLDAVQEWAGVERGGTRPVAGGNRVLEQCGVHDQGGIGAEPHLATLAADSEAPELATQVRKRVAERMPRTAFLLVSPEHLRERGAGNGPFRGGENGEKRQLEPPLGERLGFIALRPQERKSAEGDKRKRVDP